MTGTRISAAANYSSDPSAMDFTMYFLFSFTEYGVIPVILYTTIWHEKPSSPSTQHETSAGGICTVGDMAVVVVCNKTGGDANTAVGTASMGDDGLITMGILVAGMKMQAGLGVVDAV